MDSLSQARAQNLLSQPDGSDLVDLNNDGIVEIGIGGNDWYEIELKGKVNLSN